jgi:hypothetical protein
MDLAKRETRTFSSAVFARNLVEKLGGSVKMHKVPLRSAGFRVLSAPDVPSVLIELGYMSSPKDAELAQFGRLGGRRPWHAVHAAAIDGYFEQRPGLPARLRRTGADLSRAKGCASQRICVKCGRKATVPPSPSCYRIDSRCPFFGR